MLYIQFLTHLAHFHRGGPYPKKVVEEVDKVAVARDEFCQKVSEILSSKVKKDVNVSILAAQRLFKQYSTFQILIKAVGIIAINFCHQCNDY